MRILKIAAFSYQGKGGNPAGVAILDTMPDEPTMLAVAKEVGYSETAFLHPYQEGWRIRYFAPEIEVPFCGHATIATGAALAKTFKENTYRLYLNEGEINVQTRKQGDTYVVSLHSPQTWSKPAPENLTQNVLAHFAWTDEVLHPNYPVHLAFAGAKHLILALKDRATLAAMEYDFDALQATCIEYNLATVAAIWIESNTRIHARNPFPAGGVYEDPATGAAAAALAGYLRDIAWHGEPTFEILQGQDMHVPSRLQVAYTPEKGARIQVSGETRYLR